jgi:hypothetical protein
MREKGSRVIGARAVRFTLHGAGPAADGGYAERPSLRAW